MFCAECGARNEEEAKFCEGCGATISIGTQGGRSSSSMTVGGGNIVSTLRHPKESVYFTIAAIVGVFVWLGMIWLVILFACFIIPVIIGILILEALFRANLLGNSVKVGKSQYPEINALIEKNCQALGMKSHPDVFVFNSEGAINALAIKWLRGRYVILYSELIDMMSGHNTDAELDFIIGHELGHHAARHTAMWKNLLLKPAFLIPFFYPAYSRSCELTSDRIGAYLCGSRETASRALATLACGSHILVPKTNLVALKNQEKKMNRFFAFIGDLFSTHPRITKRLIELENAAHLIKA